MRVIKSLIRSLVASPKRPYYDTDTKLQLDLAYVTPNVIVTSAPVSSYLESWYRYPLDDLLVYLKSKHGDNWHLFNFRGEGAGYSYEQVSGKVSHYPFPDHYPPTMEIMIGCVSEMAQFLRSSTQNVAVLHCKAGKGRSGTLCCAYLIYQLREFTLEHILLLYTLRRMNTFAGEGISIKSQKRYLGYWYECVHSEALREKYLSWQPGVLRIASIRFRGISSSNLFGLGLSLLEYVKQEQNTVVRPLVKFTESNSHVKQYGEWTIYKLNEPLLVSSEDLMVGVKSWCYLWFNVYFESGCNNEHGDGSHQANFAWNEFDGFKALTRRDQGCLMRWKFIGETTNLDIELLYTHVNLHVFHYQSLTKTASMLSAPNLDASYRSLFTSWTLDFALVKGFVILTSS
ncbi:Phosphatidylinositol 3,4,5-trisphosphate 3-phosphatase and dual-specificity protein phosphatase PTEN [Candida viswanathii]|uniref:phosphatidylinositol-3,4,5-trisphosphate 3-phosphatase n=1 Tax=Candida viswanathii TaxID=5486 RepID=A0A367YI52_9ASCO|nr:Phosphatidylinositol 3,4,5-trisphosphate 3-phosphatase and dual-specificity protein phosphatase PTEN [Candida viswanathii]